MLVHTAIAPRVLAGLLELLSILLSVAFHFLKLMIMDLDCSFTGWRNYYEGLVFTKFFLSGAKGSSSTLLP